jgi:outer membrane protein TolC
MRNRSWSAAGIPALLFAVWLSVPAWAAAQSLSMREAVELAVKHANVLAISNAEQQSAAAGYSNLRSAYLPQLLGGSGVGPSYGFPLALQGSAPAIFSVTAQSALIHPELVSFIHAAQKDFSAAAFHTADQRDQVIQDTVLKYAELAKWENRLEHLNEIYPDAEKFRAAVADRVKEGIDSELDVTRARLSEARLRLRIAEAKGSIDVIREHLSKLTGLPVANIHTQGDDLPAFPNIATDDSVPERAADASPAVRSAIEHARAQYLRAQGEHRSLLPSVDFATQYARLTTFNNYQDYYTPVRPCATSIGTVLCPSGTFQVDNATLGVSIHIPIFNASQRAKARAADADAVKAKDQANAAHNQISEETLRLQRTVTQLEAAKEVAELDSEIAQKNLEAVQTRMESSTANLHDLDDVRTQANEKLMALQDVTFELDRSQIALLRATGSLESWAMGK